MATAQHWLIVVSRAWRKVKSDWDAWCARSLADEDIIRARRRQWLLEPSPIGLEPMAPRWATATHGRPDKGSLLDGTVIKTRIDRRATNISVPAAIGVRRDGATGPAFHHE